MGTHNIQRSTYITTVHTATYGNRPVIFNRYTKITTLHKKLFSHLPRRTDKSLLFANAKMIYLNMEENKKKILMENKGIAGIYLITNKINKKHYVGKSTNLSRRLEKYFSEVHLKRKGASKIDNIIFKKGHKNFSLTILDIIEKDDKKLLAQQEQFYIDAFKPLYNVRKVVSIKKAKD